jgi:hypothetical protein
MKLILTLILLLIIIKLFFDNKKENFNQEINYETEYQISLVKSDAASSTLKDTEDISTSSEAVAKATAAASAAVSALSKVANDKAEAEKDPDALTVSSDIIAKAATTAANAASTIAKFAENKANKDKEIVAKKTKEKEEAEAKVVAAKTAADNNRTTKPPTTTKQSMLYDFKSHTFTNAGKSGPQGPTLQEVKQAYSGVNWAQNSEFLNMTTQGIQEWKVPATGTYKIRAAGAMGGNSTDSNMGGKGIDLSITTTLNKGELIKILVGQGGISANANNSSDGAGGGGGTFVVRDVSTPIIVAGGGGGATSNIVLTNYSGDKNGGNGTQTTKGGGGGRGSQSNMIAKSGIDGNGATTSNETIGNGNGSPGGGLLSNGVFYNTSQPVGIAFVNGGLGGGNTGGFGGGAGGYQDYRFTGGGGGGYSGGAGAIYDGNSNGFPLYTAGGGGSYSITGKFDTEEFNPNVNGSVIITLIDTNQQNQSNTTTSAPIPALYAFKSHTFTTAGKSGPQGPTLQEVKQVYSGVNWAQNSEFLNMTTQGIQEWKVPVTGNYTIRAVGARGGNSLDGNKGGDGIDISTITTLNKGEIIKILVGQLGLDEKNGNTPIGGGGGTFVVRDTKTPIIVAGGGGGATSSKHFSTYSGSKNGLNANSSTNGSGGGTSVHSNGKVIAGENGNGAAMTTPTGHGYGGQGGGLLSDGQNAQYEPSGKGFINGGIGGSSFGGFGGGACGYNNGNVSSHGGGGGGGYSGGAGAVYSYIDQSRMYFYSAGGGGSYAISKMIENGFNKGDGSVTITLNDTNVGSNVDFIPIFKRDSNEANGSDGLYKVDIRGGSVFPCYNITTSGYINGGQFGSVLDNDDTTGVDIEKNSDFKMPYKIVITLPQEKTFKGTFTMRLITPWTSKLPKRVALATYNNNAFTKNWWTYKQDEDNLFKIQEVDLGDVGGTGNGPYDHSFNVNFTQPFKHIALLIYSGWTQDGNVSGQAGAIWITSINFKSN